MSFPIECLAGGRFLHILLFCFPACFRFFNQETSRSTNVLLQAMFTFMENLCLLRSWIKAHIWYQLEIKSATDPARWKKSYAHITTLNFVDMKESYNIHDCWSNGKHWNNGHWDMSTNGIRKKATNANDNTLKMMKNYNLWIRQWFMWLLFSNCYLNTFSKLLMEWTLCTDIWSFTNELMEQHKMFAWYYIVNKNIVKEYDSFDCEWNKSEKNWIEFWNRKSTLLRNFR